MPQPAEWQAIGEDPEKFAAFVKAANRQGIKIGRDRLILNVPAQTVFECQAIFRNKRVTHIAFVKFGAKTQSGLEH